MTKEEMSKLGYKAYENEDIIVYWNPNMCEHVAKCVLGNRKVFNPSRRPWIDLSFDSAQNIAKIIDQCPSKALMYQLKK